MSVIIKIDTGFVGATHEEETGLSVEQWNAMSDTDKQDWMQEAINDRIEVYAVDEDDEDKILE